MYFTFLDQETSYSFDIQPIFVDVGPVTAALAASRSSVIYVWCRKTGWYNQENLENHVYR